MERLGCQRQALMALDGESVLFMYCFACVQARGLPMTMILSVVSWMAPAGTSIFCEAAKLSNRVPRSLKAVAAVCRWCRCSALLASVQMCRF